MSTKGRYTHAGKLIREAQEYDLTSHDQLGSFCKYLSCVQHIATILGDDATTHRDLLLLNGNGAKSVLVMARKCLERAEDIFIDITNNSKTLPADKPPELPPKNESVGNIAPPGVVAPPTERGIGKLSGSHSPVINRLHSLSPMEEAKMKNQKLMSVYQEHLKKRASSLLPQDCNRLNLDMWKKIEQNNMIARMKEKALQQKLHERTSRISKAPKPRAQSMMDHSVGEICDLIISFETNKGNFSSLKLSLQQHPGDHTHLYNLINEVFSTAEHPLSKLLAECQYNVCESIKPLVLATAKGGNFPSVTILPVSRHPDDPLPSIRTPSGDITSSVDSSVGSSGIGRSHSVPEVSDNMVTSLHKMHQSQSIPPLARKAGSHDDDDDASEVFMSPPAVAKDVTGLALPQVAMVNDVTVNGTSQVESDKAANSQPETVTEGTPNGEALYFVLERPPTLPSRDEKPSTPSDKPPAPANKPSTANTPSDKSTPSDKPYPLANTPGDKPSTPGYEEIDETTIEKVRPPSPTPYEMPSLSRQESYDPYYSNIGSPETSGYTLLSQWTRSAPESDYTQLDPQTVINKTTSTGTVATVSYPTLNCSVHLGKKEVLEPLSEKVSLSTEVIVREIHLYLDKMEQVFNMYQGMESNKETCRDIVEQIFFPPLWPNLVQLYRCCNYRQEVALALNISNHVNSLPRDLSIREQFQLLGSAQLPYSSAIEELKKIPEANSPSPKLEILVSMSRRICQAIEEYHAEKGQAHADSSVGVDDMLPILCYIILRVGLPQMVTECSIMDEFIQEGYLMGEEGFCLTSFQTALRYLTTMTS